MKDVCKMKTAYLQVSFAYVLTCFLNTVWAYSIKGKRIIHSNDYTIQMLPYTVDCHALMTFNYEMFNL